MLRSEGPAVSSLVREDGETLVKSLEALRAGTRIVAHLRRSSNYYAHLPRPHGRGY
jgi:hypothetical protein